MLLTVDVGNTQTAIGLFDGEEVVEHWRLASNGDDTADELRLKVCSLLQIDGRGAGDIAGVALSSVVPSITDLWDDVAVRLSGKPCVKAGTKTAPWIPIAYDNPAEIGADRIADAAAALQLYGPPVVVVDLGTATNIEVIGKGGEFMGGIIAPGLRTSSDALFDSAARIPRFDIVEPRSAIGKTTVEAVRSGLLYGEVDKVDGLVRRIWDELGYETKVIGTGGLVSTISGLSRTITDVDADLTLKGLRIIYERNQAQSQG